MHLLSAAVKACVPALGPVLRHYRLPAATICTAPAANSLPHSIKIFELIRPVCFHSGPLLDFLYTTVYAASCKAAQVVR